MGKLLRYLASMLPMPLGFRASLYRLSGLKVGRYVAIDRNLQITHAHNVTIGDRVTISNSVSLLGEVTAVHSRIEKEYGVYKSDRIVIEDDAYIGVKATVLPGVVIGKMATVGANSLVTADVPPRAVVLGVPARVMLIRPDPEGSEPEG